MSDNITYDTLNKMYEEAAKAPIVPHSAYITETTARELWSDELIDIGISEGWIMRVTDPVHGEGWIKIDRRKKDGQETNSTG